MTSVGERRAPAVAEPARRPLARPGAVEALAAVAVVAGLVLRTLAPSPLWLDEAQSVAIARLPVPELFDALREDGAPPLYYLLLHAWMAVFGTSDVAVRSLSVVVSVATLPVIALVAARVAGRRAVAPVLALTAVSPWAVRYATETRMYALVVLLCALGALALLRVLRGSGTGALVGLAAATAALLYTHYWAIPLLLVVGCGLLAAALRGPPHRRPAARRAVVAVVAGGLPFLAWLPTFLYQARRTAAPWGIPAGAEDVVGLALELAGTRLAIAETLGVGLLGLAVLGAVAVRRGGTLVLAPRTAGARGWTGLLAACALAVAVGIAAAGGTPVAVRYAAIVVVPVLVCAAAGVALLRRRTQAVVLVLVLVGGTASSAAQGLMLRTQAGEVAAALERRAQPGDVVVTCPDQLGPGLARELEKRGVSGLDTFTFPTAEPLARVDWVDYAERREGASAALFAAAVAARADDRSVWLVAAPGYRVYNSLCSQLGDALEELRPSDERVVRLRAASFEADGLTRYPPLEATS